MHGATKFIEPAIYPAFSVPTLCSGGYYLELDYFSFIPDIYSSRGGVKLQPQSSLFWDVVEDVNQRSCSRELVAPGPL